MTTQKVAIWGYEVEATVQVDKTIKTLLGETRHVEFTVTDENIIAMNGGEDRFTSWQTGSVGDPIESRW